MTINVRIYLIICHILVFFSLLSCSTLDEDFGIVDDQPSTIDIDETLNITSAYFIVFGDIQAYTANERNLFYYRSSLDWINEQATNGAKIIDVIQVGDITQSNSFKQWERFAQSSIRTADIIPFFVCVGNHDYTWNDKSQITDRNSTLLNEYAHFPKTDSHIIDYFSTNSLENYVASLSDRAGTKLLVLEFGPRKEVLVWAKRYVEEHSDDNFILLTHAWLRGNGQRISMGSNIDQQLNGYTSYSTPEEIWDVLVKPNDNIRCVICGHDGFLAKLFSINNAGREVPQILFNLQEQENGGNGLVQLWELPINSDNVNICVYDTINRDWYKPESTSISFPL